MTTVVVAVKDGLPPSRARSRNWKTKILESVSHEMYCDKIENMIFQEIARQCQTEEVV